MSNWILTKNKLPEMAKRVLVCNNNGFVYIAWRYNTGWQFDSGTGEIIDDTPEEYQINAWMPLPDPAIEAKYLN